MAVVLVGAIFVGSIETVWAGEVTPPRGKAIKVTTYPPSDSAVELQTGDELGRFNMGGSTIIVLFGPGIEGCLGDCQSWGRRWARADARGAGWSGVYVVRGAGDAVIRGQVQPSEPLSVLAQDVRELAERAGEAALRQRVR